MRFLARYLQESEPTLGEVGLAVAALSALSDGPRPEAVQVLRVLIGSF